MKIKRILSLVTALAMTAGLYVPTAMAEEADEFIAYDAYAALQFEGPNYPDKSSWGGSAENPITVEFVNEGGYESNGALHVNSAAEGGGKFSVWGGPVGGGVAPNAPVAGDEVEGYFWYKRLRAGGSSLPFVRIYSEATGNNADGWLAVTENYNNVDLDTIAPVGEWVKINLVTTGNVVAAGDELHLGFNITEDSTGSEFLIDNIVFGTKTQRGAAATEGPAEPTQVPVAAQEEDATAAFDILQFEDASAFTSGNSYGTFTITNENVNKGIGALSTSSSFSLWGGGSVANAPAGSTISGTVAFRLDQPMYDAATSLANGSAWFRFPSIKVVRASDKEVLAELTQEDFNISEYEANTWITVDIPSTGETFSSDDPIEYTVARPAGGAKIMVDSITFKVTSPSDPSATAEPIEQGTTVSGTIPKVESYVGFNGDFESVSGALYQQTSWPDNWGMWTQNQNVDNGVDAFNFIKNTNEAYSGTAMIQPVRGGTMWSIRKAENGIDEIIGNTVGGSYMLYVNDPTDVRFYPQVTVTYVVGGTETTASASPKSTDEFALTAGWNKIPIYSNLVIPADADRVNLMIINPSLGAEYPQTFYLDNIVVGTELSEIYIAEASSADVNDGSVDCSIVVANSKTAEDTIADIIAAVYDGNRLVGASFIRNAQIKGNGGSGVASTKFETTVDVPTGSADLKVKAMVWDSEMVPVAESGVIYGSNAMIPYDDANIQYVGRWQDNGNCMSSGWGGAYFKTGFTGTSAALELKGAANIYVSIDGGAEVPYSPAGAGTLVVAKGLDGGSHTLRVASKYTFDSIRLEGITLDENAELEAPQMSDVLIEFIGDSNTAGYLLPNNQLDNYSWITGEDLGVEHVHIAYTGMALSDGIFNNNIKRDVGMSVMYNKPNPIDERDADNWDSTTYSPDLICVNIGANDMNQTAVPGGAAAFEEALPTFLAHLRDIHPDAEIVVLIPTSSAQGTALHTIIPNVVSGMNDEKMNYYDANAWIKDDMATNVLSDGVHISPQGNHVVAQHLEEIFAALLGWE